MTRGSGSICPHPRTLNREESPAAGDDVIGHTVRRGPGDGPAVGGQVTDLLGGLPHLRTISAQRTSRICFVTRAGYRKRGVAGALVRATVDFARERGARALEGYPITTKNVILEELGVGTHGMFAAAGFVEVSRPTLRRAVMRIDFGVRPRRGGSRPS
jgi:GNAT superfamily N-acetyltransferase